jgi:hypothetical protein
MVALIRCLRYVRISGGGCISLDILPNFFNILAGYYSIMQAWNSCCITLIMPPFLDSILIDLTIVSGE